MFVVEADLNVTLCAPKPTSFVDIISIEEKCVQSVTEVLDISKKWKEFIKKDKRIKVILSGIPFFSNEKCVIIYFICGKIR